jgi:hypothetical protein
MLRCPLEFGSGFSIDTLAEVARTDRQFRQTELHPLAESGTFTKINVSLALYRAGKPWTLRLVGRNIFAMKTLLVRQRHSSIYLEVYGAFVR